MPPSESKPGDDERASGPKRPDTSRRRGFDGAADTAPLEVVADILVQSGTEGEQLARQQTRVLREVTRWLTQQAPEHRQAAA